MASKQFSHITLEPHLIESSKEFDRFCARFVNPNDVRSRLIRVLREMPDCDVDEITSVAVEQVVQRLKAKGYNQTYVRRLFTVFKSFLTWLYDEEIISRNPAKNITVRAPYLYEPVLFERDDVMRFTDWIKEHGTHEDVVLWASLRSGTRINEPARARVQDVRLDEIAEIPALRFLNTKTGIPRMVVLASWAYESVKALQEASTHPEEFLIDLPVTPTTSARVQRLRKRYYELQRECFGEVRFSAKGMRSTTATWLADECDSTSELKEAAGHLGHTVQTMLERYVAPKKAKKFQSLE